MLNKSKNLSANVNSYNRDIKTRTPVILKIYFYFKHNSFKNDINIIIIFKVLYISSAQEIIMLISHKHKKYLIETFSDFYNLNIFTREKALKYLSSRIKTFHKVNDIQTTLEIVSSILIALLPVIRGNYHPKVLFLALMAQ